MTYDNVRTAAAEDISNLYCGNLNILRCNWQRTKLHYQHYMYRNVTSHFNLVPIRFAPTHHKHRGAHG